MLNKILSQFIMGCSGSSSTKVANSAIISMNKPTTKPEQNEKIVTKSNNNASSTANSKNNDPGKVIQIQNH